MRIVFAGTPEPAVPSLRALFGLRPRSSGRRDAAARSHRSWAHPAAEPGRCTGRRRGDPGAQPGRRALARIRRPTGRPGSGRGCNRRLWRAAATGRAGRPHPRLDQPALLRAPRVARRRAGARRGPARRRHHRRDDLPPRGGHGHRAGVRHRHRDHPTHRHHRRAPGPARRQRRRAAGRHPGRYRGRHGSRAAAAGPRDQLRAEVDGRRPDRALDRPCPGDRAHRPIAHPGARRVHDLSW